jgi:hypothetical protein
MRSTFMNKPTFNNMVREKRLIRNNGVPVSKIRDRQEFIPINPAEAKNSIKNENFVMFRDLYGYKKQVDF